MFAGSAPLALQEGPGGLDFWVLPKGRELQMRTPGSERGRDGGFESWDRRGLGSLTPGF